MKTAQEWIGRLPQEFNRHATRVLTVVDIAAIEKIQLDAIKHGMKIAAQIAEQKLHECGMNHEGKTASAFIFTASDKLTEWPVERLTKANAGLVDHLLKCPTPFDVPKRD